MLEIRQTIDKNLEKALNNSNWTDSKITPILKDYILRGGKRLRPLAVFVTAKMFGVDDFEKIMPTAIAFELLHNGTLLHDDIVDDSDMRRGKPTMHIEFGLGMTILVTDYLLGVIYSILASNYSILDESQSTKILELVNNSFITITRAQVLEFEVSKDPNTVDEKTIVEILLGKTASLFQACILSGAIIGGVTSEDHFKALQEYSKGIGVAFQLQDDVLNIVGEEKEYGKEIGGDILEGKITLLLCRALEKANEQQKVILSTIFTKNREDRNANDISKVISIYKELNVINDITSEAKKWQKRSIDSLSILPKGDARDFLEYIAQYTIDRQL